MLRYGLRLHRWGTLGFGLVAFLSTTAQGAAYLKLAGSTPAERALFVKTMTALALQLSYFLPLPRHLDSLAGYVLWRAWGTLPLVIVFWAIAAGSGAARGDEEKLLVESWLASRLSRARLVAWRFAAFGAAALVMAALAGGGTLVGAAGVETIPIERLAGQVLTLWLLTLACFGLVYLVSQFPGSKRGAQVLGTVLLLGLYLFQVAARTQPSLENPAWISPFHWYDAGDVLAPGGTLNLTGIALGAVTLVASAVLAWLAFERRDLRGPLFRLRARASRARQGRTSPLLGWPVARELYRQRWIVLAWAAGIAGMAFLMVGIAHGTVNALLALPGLRGFLGPTGTDPYRGYIALIWFGIAQALLAGFAVHVVAGWAGDDSQGVLSAELSRPRRRWAIVAERAISAVVAIVLLAILGSICTLIAAQQIGVTLDSAGVFRATAMLVPFALTFAAAGAMASSWWPRAAIGVLGLLVFASYMDSALGPVLGWPAWLVNLSVFLLYGSPLLTGIYWNGLWAMLAVVVVGFGAATLLMERRELSR